MRGPTEVRPTKGDQWMIHCERCGTAVPLRPTGAVHHCLGCRLYLCGTCHDGISVRCSGCQRSTATGLRPSVGITGARDALRALRQASGGVCHRPIGSPVRRRCGGYSQGARAGQRANQAAEPRIGRTSAGSRALIPIRGRLRTGSRGMRAARPPSSSLVSSSSSPPRCS